jgi:hypothetical protein
MMRGASSGARRSSWMRTGNSAGQGSRVYDRIVIVHLCTFISSSSRAQYDQRERKTRQRIRGGNRLPPWPPYIMITLATSFTTL